MTRLEKERYKERILKLARLKCTGSPAALGIKFEISERSVKRLIKELRDNGHNLHFDYSRISYVVEINQ